MSNEVRLQNLRDFTVQIREATTDIIVGTGIVVSTGGEIVTCRHVVKAAGIDLDDKCAEASVYFPNESSVEKKKRRAKVAAYFSNHDDDVVMLQLVDGPLPLASDKIAVLGDAKMSEGNPFRSYGYRMLEDYVGGFASGIILGEVEKPLNRTMQADPLILESSEINRGMSGAAVLDTKRNLVVGIVSETWNPDSSTKDRDTAFAINVQVLTVPPFNLSLRNESFSLEDINLMLMEKRKMP